ncbi:hypothetical protein I7I53_04306 [Histoplasma capsulatum var. duboisii H88]|uniref:Uncharacterized protein n=1 Tax=Ajellomyces capsulatus (strain H88) TaxID=544711 RepID=A0A8A1LVL0_AJEC8|nr:hypothetical protein I7I53_04306 [Histoplasma capsulatum var. duboisii H88]
MYMVYMYICAGVATSSRTTHAHTTSNACIAGPPPLEIVVQVTLNPGQTKPNPSPAPSYITGGKRKMKKQIKKIKIKINRRSGQGGGWAGERRARAGTVVSTLATPAARCALHVPSQALPPGMREGGGWQ